MPPPLLENQITLLNNESKTDQSKFLICFEFIKFEELSLFTSGVFPDIVYM